MPGSRIGVSAGVLNMDKMTRRVVAKYLAKLAADVPEGPETVEPKDEPVSVGRLVDLASLVLAFDAYISSIEESGTDDNPSMTTQGITLLRRYGEDLRLAMEQHLSPLAARPDAASMKTLFRQAARTGAVTVMVRKQAELFTHLFPWMRSRPAVFNGLFTGRSTRAARELAAAAEETAPAGKLNRLATIAPVSGITIHRKWIENAAKVLGAPIKPAESVLADAQVAKGLGEDLSRVEEQISSSRSNTPEVASLQEKRLGLMEKIDQVAERSEDRSTVMSAAVSAATAPPTKSAVASRFGLSDEQTEVMNATGKVVVAAGAGSGKTQSLVATISHLIEEKGYNPGQVMTCSFTRAASAELEARLEKAGVSGVAVGTTHHMARSIIERNRPDLALSMRNTKGADKCFKMALVQVTMDAAGYQKQLEANKGYLQRIEGIPGWRSIDILRSFHEQLSKGRSLSEKQLAVLPKFERSRRWGYNQHAESENLDRQWFGTAAPAPAMQVKKAETNPEKGEDLGGSKRSKFWTMPAGEWFNIGKPLTDDAGGKLSGKRAQLLVENFKNSGISVDQARAEQGDTPPVALYGAYEWLKKNDPVHGPAMDFTDQLVTALQIVSEDPAALAAEQSQYKVILVDEAQDLNSIQFQLFQRVGEKADVMMYIGDDKQSIYAFRGAKPSNYVGLTKTEGYQTKLMTLNYRSGSQIVDAANRLIAYNEDRQVPMTCKAHEAKGPGAIRAKTPGTHEEGAVLVAQEIKDAIDAGESASHFGILVRNNAETDAFMLALISRGIPYRTLRKEQGGYFGKPVVRALTAWIRLIIGGSPAEINDAVIEAHHTPGFGLDQQFEANLGRMSRGGTYLDYIQAGGEVYSGQAAWLNRRVKDYADAIRTVRAEGRGESGMMIRSIFKLKGSKGTFVDALMKMVDEDDVLEDEGVEGGEDALKMAALAPVRPLMQMAENFPDPANLMHFIGKMKAANEKVQKRTPESKDDFKEAAVLLGTVHGWKGLQAKHVYVCMAGGVFPNFRSDEKALKQEMEHQPVTAYDEERRLAYVGITRGEQSSTVICPRFNYLGKEAAVSRFASEACIPFEGAMEQDKEKEQTEQAKTAGLIQDSIDQLREIGQ